MKSQFGCPSKNSSEVKPVRFSHDGVPRELSVQAYPMVTNMLWDGDRNIVEGDRRAGLVTECEGEVGTLGPIRLNSLQ